MPIQRILILAFAGFIISWCAIADAKTVKDYLIVLDTSYSMSGKGGQNIIESVKTSLNSYIDKIENGDSLTLITFDSEVKVYPTVTLTSVNDRDIVKKYYSMIEAKGKWTFTLEMLKKVFLTADGIQKANKDHQVVILVMTDGLDDPPPVNKKDKLSLKEVAKEYTGNEWYIYLVNFSDILNNPQFQKIASDVSIVSANTKVVNADGSADNAIAQVDSSVDEMTRQQERKALLAKILIISGIAALALILFILFRIRQAKLKISGVLEYRSVISPYKEYDMFDLGRLHERSLAIGRGAQFRVNLRDFEERVPVVLQAERFGGAIRPVVKEAVSSPVEFLNGKQTSFLSDGDSFKAGGYIFVYREKA